MVDLDISEQEIAEKTMTYLERRHAYYKEMQHTDTLLIYEFFSVYSRFEFVLKKIGMYQVRRGQWVYPDSQMFAREIEGDLDFESTPEMNTAIKYYLNSPPMIEIDQKGKVAWMENMQRSNESKLQWIFRSIGIVRNNLFHGGKFPWDAVRDRKLLDYGLTIIFASLELNEKYMRIFQAG